MQVTRPTVSAGRIPCLTPAQAALIVAHIEQRFTGRIDLSELAALVHLSRGHFCRVFRGSFGERPRNYLMRRRMRHAQDLMLASDEPLSQIALACGMADQPHFSNVFRRLVGQTPSQWRRQNMSPDDAPLTCVQAQHVRLAQPEIDAAGLDRQVARYLAD